MNLHLPPCPTVSWNRALGLCVRHRCGLEAFEEELKLLRIELLTRCALPSGCLRQSISAALRFTLAAEELRLEFFTLPLGLLVPLAFFGKKAIAFQQCALERGGFGLQFGCGGRGDAVWIARTDHDAMERRIGTAEWSGSSKAGTPSWTARGGADREFWESKGMKKGIPRPNKALLFPNKLVRRFSTKVPNSCREKLVVCEAHVTQNPVGNRLGKQLPPLGSVDIFGFLRVGEEGTFD